jgi:hypothetical protein
LELIEILFPGSWKSYKVKVYENNGWTKIGENSGLVLMIIDTAGYYNWDITDLVPP